MAFPNSHREFIRSGEACSKTKCRTTFHSSNLCLFWTIGGFSLCPNSNGKSIQSDKFSTQDNDMTWSISLYAGGDTKWNKDYLSLYLTLVKSNRERTMAKFRFSIVDHRKSRKNTLLSDRVVHFFKGDSFGFPRFLERSYLFMNACDFLHNDELNVSCEIKVVKGYTSSWCEPELLPDEPQSSMLSESLGELLELKHHSDVTISANGKEFSAHKAILSARSAVFQAMFTGGTIENTSNKVNVVDIEPNVVEEMLWYIYTEKTRDLENVAEGLLYAANKYELRNLKRKCEKALCYKMSLENAVDILLLADMHNAEELKSFAIGFINSNRHIITDTAAFERLLSTSPRLIIEAYIAIKMNEVELH